MVIFGYTLRRDFEISVPVPLDEAKAHAKSLLSGLFSDGSFKDDRISLQNTIFGSPWTLFIPAELSGTLKARGGETIVSGTVGITTSKLISIAMFEALLAAAIFLYVKSMIRFLTEHSPEAVDLVFMMLGLAMLLGGFIGMLAYTVRNARVGSDHLLSELKMVLRGQSAGRLI